jgi:hypothetical protein
MNSQSRVAHFDFDFGGHAISPRVVAHGQELLL